jgi:tRNA pseudouridine38-40 synthase
MARYSHWLRAPLDLAYLNEASHFLVKEQDFKSFQSVGTPVHTTVREVFAAQWRRRTQTLVEFRITGSGFLKQMVRNVVGTLIKMNLDHSPVDHLVDILAAQDRRRAGPTAPPQGLFLRRVYYPQELDNECLRI